MFVSPVLNLWLWRLLSLPKICLCCEEAFPHVESKSPLWILKSFLLIQSEGTFKPFGSVDMQGVGRRQGCSGGEKPGFLKEKTSFMLGKEGCGFDVLHKLRN